MSDDNSAATFEDRLRELIAFVEDSLLSVQGDKMPDLGDLDGNVSTLCQDIESAGAETAQQVQPLMANMITKLDELAQALKAYQQKNRKE